MSVSWCVGLRRCFFCLFVCLLVCWFVCWFVGLLVCWFVCLFVCLFVCWFLIVKLLSSWFDGVYLSIYIDFTDLRCCWLVQVCWLLSYLSC